MFQLGCLGCPAARVFSAISHRRPPPFCLLKRCRAACRGRRPLTHRLPPVSIRLAVGPWREEDSAGAAGQQTELCGLRRGSCGETRPRECWPFGGSCDRSTYKCQGGYGRVATPQLNRGQIQPRRKSTECAVPVPYFLDAQVESYEKAPKGVRTLSLKVVLFQAFMSFSFFSICPNSFVLGKKKNVSLDG